MAPKRGSIYDVLHDGGGGQIFATNFNFLQLKKLSKIKTTFFVSFGISVHRIRLRKHKSLERLSQKFFKIMLKLKNINKLTMFSIGF